MVFPSIPTFTAALVALLSLSAHADDYVAPVDADTEIAHGRWELGAVTDVRRSDKDGIIVLAVTPGGAAERLGLRVGDRLRTINGESLGDTSRPNQVLRDALAGSHGQVRLDVLREGKPLTLSGMLDNGVPAAATAVGTALGCGYVSTVGVPPRATELIFDAEITMIDGNSTPLRPNNRYRLKEGRHVLVVREHIDDHRFTLNQNLQRQRMLRRERIRAHKALVVDIAPGIRYSIGAKLLKDRLDTSSIRDNAYWEPVIWASRPETCG